MFPAKTVCIWHLFTYSEFHLWCVADAVSDTLLLFCFQTKSPSKAAGMFSGTQEKCATCGKTAYPLEKVGV